MKKTIAILSLLGLAACQNTLDLQADKSLVTQLANQSPAIGTIPTTIVTDCDQIVDAAMLEDILVQADIVQAGLNIVPQADFCQVNFKLTAGAVAMLTPASAVDANLQLAALVDALYGALIKSSHIAATGSFAVQSVDAADFQGIPGIAVGARILDNQIDVAGSKAALLADVNEVSFLLFEKF